MNEQLIKFIELCLMDGVVSDKEREVIFRKSKELGVPEDECEIILEGMMGQKRSVTNSIVHEKTVINLINVWSLNHHWYQTTLIFYKLILKIVFEKDL